MQINFLKLKQYFLKDKIVSTVVLTLWLTISTGQ